MCEGEIGTRKKGEDRGDRGDRRTAGMLQREMSLPTGCSCWNSGHVTLQMERVPVCFVAAKTACCTVSSVFSYLEENSTIC